MKISLSHGGVWNNGAIHSFLNYTTLTIFSDDNSWTNQCGFPKSIIFGRHNRKILVKKYTKKISCNFIQIFFKIKAVTKSTKSLQILEKKKGFFFPQKISKFLHPKSCKIHARNPLQIGKITLFKLDAKFGNKIWYLWSLRRLKVCEGQGYV